MDSQAQVSKGATTPAELKPCPVKALHEASPGDVRAGINISLQQQTPESDVCCGRKKALGDFDREWAMTLGQGA